MKITSKVYIQILLLYFTSQNCQTLIYCLSSMVKKYIKSKSKMQKNNQHSNKKLINPEKKQQIKKQKMPNNKPVLIDLIEDQQLETINAKMNSLKIYSQCDTADNDIQETKTQGKMKTRRIKKIQEKDLKSTQTLYQDEYLKFVTQNCKKHYKSKSNSKQKQKQPNTSISHPIITLNWFSKIRQLWKKPQKQVQVIKTTSKIKYVQKITGSMIKRLKPKHWLNDQIVNSYIQLLQQDEIAKHFHKNEKSKKKHLAVSIIGSHLTLYRDKLQRLDRQIQKNNITPQSLVIIAIFEENHWFFITIFNKQLSIFDSLLSKKMQSNQKSLKKQYLSKLSIKVVIRLYEKIYETQQILIKNISIVPNFPQQNNKDDCGVMMLGGIRNIIKRCSQIQAEQKDSKILHQAFSAQKFWNFCVNDAHYLRYLFTREILQQKIIEL